MLTVTIGDIVGMSHETHYTREGRAVAVHRPHRAITASVSGFHLPETGTFHRMRRYVVESPDAGDWCRFVWKTYCGLWWLFVDAHGECSEAPSGTDLWPFCHRCQTCQRLADDEAFGREMRRRLKTLQPQE